MEQTMLSYRAWQHGLGLLAVPLYRERDAGTKHVLLNGISGNFCLDEEEGIPLVDRCAVAWSSNIGHHLTTTPNYVEVVRWDKPDSAERYTVASIQNNLEDFHRYLEKAPPRAITPSSVMHSAFFGQFARDFAKAQPVLARSRLSSTCSAVSPAGRSPERTYPLTGHYRRPQKLSFKIFHWPIKAIFLTDCPATSVRSACFGPTLLFF